MPGAHARLSPSAAYIWTRCPGMPTLAAGLPSYSSEHARRGTAAHKVLEWCLEHRRDADYYAGQTVPTGDKGGAISLDEDDLGAVQLALDWIRAETCEEGDELRTEQRLRYADDLWGTADVIRYRPATRELLVFDYKHGSGTIVEVEDNPQLLLYGLMAAKSLGNRGIDTVRMVVGQPRAFHADGPVREWKLDALDLIEREAAIVEAVEEARKATSAHRVLDKRAPEEWAAAWLAPGDHCRWCDAAAVCPALKAKADAELASDFAPVDEPGPVSAPAYDVGELAAALEAADLLEARAKAVREFAYREAERGVPIPRFKLVPKQARRRWRDIDEALGALGLFFDPETLLTPRELVSPAQVEEALLAHMPGKTKKAREEAAKACVKDYTVSESSGRVLVPESDKRAAVAPMRGDVTDDFAPVE